MCARSCSELRLRHLHALLSFLHLARRRITAADALAAVATTASYCCCEISCFRHQRLHARQIAVRLCCVGLHFPDARLRGGQAFVGLVNLLLRRCDLGFLLRDSGFGSASCVDVLMDVIGTPVRYSFSVAIASASSPRAFSTAA